MMRNGILLWAVLVLTAFAVAEPAANRVFYVAPQGNDAWSGALADPNPEGSDGPFATLLRARDALRDATGNAPAGGIVYVRGGTYYLDAPLVLEAVDSGVPGQPRLWQNYPGESVRLVGGKPLTGFVPFHDSILQLKLDGPGGEALPDLYCDSERLVLARWPNRGTDDMPGGQWAFVAKNAPENPNTTYFYEGDRPAGWKNTSQLQVSIWPNYNWWQTIAGVASLDTSARKIVLADTLPYTIEPGRRFFFQNVLEELDTPGEWFHDKATNTLYLWPPKDPATAEIVAPRLDNAIIVRGAVQTTLLGFTIEATRADGVRFEDAAESMLARSVIRNTGGYGVVVEGGHAVRVHGNDIYETGRGGISLNGGDRPTLVPGNHSAVNNHIHHFGRIWQTYQTGVNVSGVGNRVAHNLIHDAPHIAILLGGNEHIIEYNDVHHICLEGADNGGFYMGRDWTQRGNILRFNKFHDIYGFGLSGLGPDSSGKFQYETPHQAWGVYLDDCSSGTAIFGNLFYRVPLCGVMIGGGRDNRVVNNVFVDCIPALHIDARWDAYPWDLMRERLEAMHCNEPPYSERYPELLAMGDDPRRPANNAFTNNIVAYTRDDFRGLSSTAPTPEAAVVYNLAPFDATSTVFNKNLIYHPDFPVRVAWSAYGEPGSSILTWEEWQAKGFDAESLLADPLFANPAVDDYRLGKDSPATKTLGFQPIQTHKIGLFEDEFRASWPPPVDTRREGVEHHTWPVEPPAP